VSPSVKRLEFVLLCKHVSLGSGAAFDGMQYVYTPGKLRICHCVFVVLTCCKCQITLTYFMRSCPNRFHDCLVLIQCEKSCQLKSVAMWNDLQRVTCVENNSVCSKQEAECAGFAFLCDITDAVVLFILTYYFTFISTMSVMKILELIDMADLEH